MGRSLILTIVLVAACGAPSASSPSASQPDTSLRLPAADERLPVDAAAATDWEESHGRLPAGFDAIEFHPSDEALGDAFYAALRRRFNGDPVPVVEVSALDRTSGQAVMLVTSTGFGGEGSSGDQILLVLLREQDGWRVDRTLHRFLCRVIGPDCGGD